MQKKNDVAGAKLYDRLVAVVKNSGSFYVPEHNLIAFDATADQYHESTIENPADWLLDQDTTLARPDYGGSVIESDTLEQIVKKLTSTSEFVQFAAPIGGGLVLDSGLQLVQMICPELRKGLRFGDLISTTKAPFRSCYVSFEGKDFITEREDDENDANIPVDSTSPELEVDFADVLDCVEAELQRRAEQSGPLSRWTRIRSVWPAIRYMVQSGVNRGDLVEIAKEVDISPSTLRDYWNQIKEIAADCLGEKS